MEHVCLEMPQTVRKECLNFVDKYIDQIVEMVVADFTPQEICVYAKLCDPPKSVVGGDISKYLLLYKLNEAYTFSRNHYAGKLP